MLGRETEWNRENGAKEAVKYEWRWEIRSIPSWRLFWMLSQVARISEFTLWSLPGPDNAEQISFRFVCPTDLVAVPFSSSDDAEAAFSLDWIPNTNSRCAKSSSMNSNICFQFNNELHFTQLSLFILTKFIVCLIPSRWTCYKWCLLHPSWEAWKDARYSCDEASVTEFSDEASQILFENLLSHK